MHDVPWAAAREALHEGSAEWSMASGLMEHISYLEGNEAKEEDDLASNAVTSACAARAET